MCMFMTHFNNSFFWQIADILTHKEDTCIIVWSSVHESHSGWISLPSKIYAPALLITLQLLTEARTNNTSNEHGWMFLKENEWKLKRHKKQLCQLKQENCVFHFPRSRKGSLDISFAQVRHSPKCRNYQKTGSEMGKFTLFWFLFRFAKTPLWRICTNEEQQRNQSWWNFKANRTHESGSQQTEVSTWQQRNPMNRCAKEVQ